MEHQENVWDLEYGERGTKWSRRRLAFPVSFEGKVVLEAGFGDGKTLSSIIEKRPANVVAFDFSAVALERCREAFRDLKNVSFVKADAESLPFEAGSFDVVVAYYILDNMLVEGRRKAVGEFFRVLRPGGFVLFEDFAVGDFREDLGKRVGMPEAHTLLKKKGLLCHYFSVEEVRELLSDFSNVEAGLKERKPVRNRPELVRRLVSAVALK
ncbi:MAG: class I SAM-dependent methyltransferase [Candidatus Altiarchaeota archaeon]|nr:class I SAM-dependent methyltransferase [Candidatus Altiarchaeota archaeon]